MGALSRSLSSKQLLLLLKASVRLLIQINTITGFLDKPKAGMMEKGLQESKDDRVLATLIRNTQELKNKQPILTSGGNSGVQNSEQVYKRYYTEKDAGQI